MKIPKREFIIHVNFVIWMNEFFYKMNLLDKMYLPSKLVTLSKNKKRKKQKFKNRNEHLVI